ncbi:MAG: hypothetical protein HYV96_21195 [Opitutae bacterium]|nr:hypothetical protein [Opitutae bacterium]
MNKDTGSSDQKNRNAPQRWEKFVTHFKRTPAPAGTEIILDDYQAGRITSEAARSRLVALGFSERIARFLVQDE